MWLLHFWLFLVAADFFIFDKISKYFSRFWLFIDVDYADYYFHFAAISMPSFCDDDVEPMMSWWWCDYWWWLMPMSWCILIDVPKCGWWWPMLLRTLLFISTISSFSRDAEHFHATFRCISLDAELFSWWRGPDADCSPMMIDIFAVAATPMCRITLITRRCSHFGRLHFLSPPPWLRVMPIDFLKIIFIDAFRVFSLLRWFLAIFADFSMLRCGLISISLRCRGFLSSRFLLSSSQPDFLFDAASLLGYGRCQMMIFSAEMPWWWLRRWCRADFKIDFDWLICTDEEIDVSVVVNIFLLPDVVWNVISDVNIEGRCEMISAADYVDDFLPPMIIFHDVTFLRLIDLIVREVDAKYDVMSLMMYKILIDASRRRWCRFLIDDLMMKYADGRFRHASLIDFDVVKHFDTLYHFLLDCERFRQHVEVMRRNAWCKHLPIT